MSIHDQVHIFEVGPRDGLQNENQTIPTGDKIKFIRDLIRSGVENLEIGSFVHPKKVPQMADSEKICKKIFSSPYGFKSSKAWCLIPNRYGLERALNSGVTNIALFTAATESFTQKNIGVSIRESLIEYTEVIKTARSTLGKKLKVRAYISTAFGCPFEGYVSPKKTLQLMEKLHKLKVDQISIGDTIGVATPKDVEGIIKVALKHYDIHKLAVHFHDTRGTALANTLRSLDLGIRTIDSSAGGLGGCPFAPGARGNLATEDLIYMLNGMGVRSGVNLNLLCKASLTLLHKIKRPITSRYLQAFAAEHSLI